MHPTPQVLLTQTYVCVVTVLLYVNLYGGRSVETASPVVSAWTRLCPRAAQLVFGDVPVNRTRATIALGKRQRAEAEANKGVYSHLPLCD